MLTKIVFLIVVFIVGETIVNLTLFRYLKQYFGVVKTSEKRFLGLNISVFKGSLERFVLLTALVLSFSQMLIVYGALKIGTQIDEKTKINNDYFLIGNLFTLLITFIYWFIYKHTLNHFL